MADLSDSIMERDSTPGLGIDLLDLKILSEIEREPRQQVSVLAKKVGVSQKSASTRLHALLAGNVTRVAVYVSPFEIGFNFFPIIGMKVSYEQAEAVSAKIESLPNVLWTARVSGRYDLVVCAWFDGPLGVSRFLRQELTAIPGVLSTETTIGLEARKWSLPYLAGARLRMLAGKEAGHGGRLTMVSTQR